MPWWKSVWAPPAVVIVPAGLLLWGVILPGGYYNVIVTALVVWLLAGAWWAYTAALHRMRRWPLLITPIVFVACWAVASTDLPGRAVFALHRDDLETVAARHVNAGRAEVGAYTFESVGTWGGCTIFATRRPAWAKSAGLAWCPDTGPPRPGSEGDDYEHLDGDWYVFIIRHELWQNRFKGAHPWGLQLTELQNRTET